MKVVKRKLGKDQKSGQEHARIWLENKRLSEIGFTPNSYYVTQWIPKDDGFDVIETLPPILKLWLLDDDEDITAEVRKVTDKKGTSVIDLTGWVIKQFFEGYTHYTVEYDERHPHERGTSPCIIIEGASE